MASIALATVKPARRVRGRIRPSSDKSISHRYGLLAALADGRSVIRRYSAGADCAATLDCLERLRGLAHRRPGETAPGGNPGPEGRGGGGGPAGAAGPGTPGPVTRTSRSGVPAGAGSTARRSTRTPSRSRQSSVAAQSAPAQ